jgi:plasmid stabilization system protein ParE
MKYTVIVTPEAQRNVADAFDYISDHSPANADKWLRELHEQFDGLKEFPHRFGHAREQDFFPDAEIRQIIFKSHRIIFTIDESSSTVSIAFVRHAKMRAIGEEFFRSDDEAD